MSKDLCTPLALETNGTVFNLDRVSNVALGDGPTIPVLNKRFLDVWSRRVASRAQPPNCQRCDCVADQDGSGRSICQNCLSPSIAEFLKVSRKTRRHHDLYVTGNIEPESSVFVHCRSGTTLPGRTSTKMWRLRWISRSTATKTQTCRRSDPTLMTHGAFIIYLRFIFL